MNINIFCIAVSALTT